MASIQQEIKQIEQELRRRGKLKEPPNYFARLAAGEVTEREKWGMWRDLVTVWLLRARAELPEEPKIRGRARAELSEEPMTPIETAAVDLLAKDRFAHDANVDALVSQFGVSPVEASGAISIAKLHVNWADEVDRLTRWLDEANAHLPPEEQ